jgi:hypothetical protein
MGRAVIMDIRPGPTTQARRAATFHLSHLKTPTVDMARMAVTATPRRLQATDHLNKIHPPPTVNMGRGNMANPRHQAATGSQHMVNLPRPVATGNPRLQVVTASLPHRPAMGNLMASTVRQPRRAIHSRQATHNPVRRLRRCLSGRATRA